MFTEIQLKRSDRDFEVFWPHSLQYYDNESKEFISIKIFKDTLLAVSEDRQRVTTTTQVSVKKGYSPYAQLTSYW